MEDIWFKNTLKMGKEYRRARLTFDERMVRDANLTARVCLEFLKRIFGEAEVEIIKNGERI